MAWDGTATNHEKGNSQPCFIRLTYLKSLPDFVVSRLVEVRGRVQTIQCLFRAHSLANDDLCQR